MALSPGAVLYTVAGSLIFYSGFKGATLAATAKAVLSGNLTLTGTEPVGTPTVQVGATTSGVSGDSTANELTAGKYLVQNGYTPAAAAGIVACIAGESSGGNPESVGDGGTSFGLIQEHGSQYASLVTGNATADLNKQLPAIITYNNAHGSGLISMLNSITDPVQAADFYSEQFERPAVKDSDVVASVATSVYAQLAAA